MSAPIDQTGTTGMSDLSDMSDMSDRPTIVLLDGADLCSAVELAEQSGLSLDDVALLIEHGLCVPIGASGSAPASGVASIVFRMDYVVVAHAARRLRDDFELDGNGWLLAVQLWKRLRDTELELQRVQARLTRFLG